MSEPEQYEIDLSPVEQEIDPELEPLDQNRNAEPGSFKVQRPTEQDELDQLDPDYRE